MKRSITLALAAALALAGTASAQSADGYALSPWWMREPVVASIGYVKAELPANRADFSATFEVVDPSPTKATTKVTARVRDLGLILQRLAGENVRISTDIEIEPLYDQYRDRDGKLVDNRRADKIESYRVSATVEVEVRDMKALQPVYTAVVAAGPTGTSEVSFRLDPDNALRTWMHGAAVRDAAARARLSVEAAGATLGAARLIDPTGRACETDVMVSGAGRSADGVAPVVVTAPRIVRQDFEAIAPVTTVGSEQLELTATLAVDGLLNELPTIMAMIRSAPLTIEPPLQVLTAKACVIYALG